MIRLQFLQPRSCLAAIAAIAMIVGVAPQAWAQQMPTNDVYLITTFSNNGNTFNYSQPIFVVNPGSANGNPRCANIYVFDSLNEMLECCSCPVGNNGLLALSVKDLTTKPITSVIPKAGAIKIVSTDPGNGACSPLLLTNPSPTLRAWMSHIQIANTSQSIFGKGNPTPTVNVLPFQQSRLSVDEQSFLPQACGFIQFLGSGKGFCSCPQTGAPN